MNRPSRNGRQVPRAAADRWRGTRTLIIGGFGSPSLARGAGNDWSTASRTRSNAYPVSRRTGHAAFAAFLVAMTTGPLVRSGDQDRRAGPSSVRCLGLIGIARKSQLFVRVRQPPTVPLRPFAGQSCWGGGADTGLTVG